MTGDPRRMFDDPDVPDDVRDALRGMSEQPPESYDAAAGLARFQAAIGGGGGGGEGGDVGGASSAASGGVGLGKVLALGAAAAGLVGAIVLAAGGFDWVDPPADPKPAPAPMVSTAAPIAIASVDEAPVITPESLPKADLSAEPLPRSKQSKEQLYREELEHLAKLRQVASSRPSEAVRMADEGHSRFASGMLYQEREAIAIRSLARAGSSAAARARAEAFLARFPKSPFAEQIRVTVGLSK